ncbi:MAG: epimerase [Rhodospirillaceae bacterium]|nr:epimerase [Rhodospirillaceae bacterium]|tara:strand:- start:352 stop:1257 length:906 start_codon:yes stop_codon:yes gene_type:complete
MRFDRVLVTGAGGLMGGYVIDELAGHCRLSGLDILPDTRGLPHIQDTILNIDAVRRACEGVDAVVQIAAIPNIWSGSGEEIIHTNVTGTWNVLKAAEEAGVKRIIVTSSDSVIGYTVLSGAMIPPNYVPVDEKHICRPTDPYALSKKICEEMARSFVDRDAFEAVVMRPVFVLYPDLEAEVLARAADPEGYSGPVAGGHKPPGGGAMWHYIDPRDLALAYRQALELDKPGFGPYFLCGPNTLAPDTTLSRLQNKTGKEIETLDPELYKKNQFAPLYDLSFAESKLKFRAAHDLRKKLGLPE